MGLGGEKHFIRANLAMFQRTGSWLCHDWISLLGTRAARYVFQGMLPPGKEKALFDLLDVVRDLLGAVSPAGPGQDTDDSLEQLKHRVVLALHGWTQNFPASEWANVFHRLVHVPDSVFLWNSVRNFWAFFGER